MIIRYTFVLIIFVHSFVFGQNSSCNNDLICSTGYETCLSCPNDCPSCSFSGAAFYSYNGIDSDTRSIISTRQLQKPSIKNWLPSQTTPVSGLLTGFIQIELTGIYYFKVTADNIGGKIIINGADIVTFESQDSLETKTHSLYFIKNKIVKIEVSMFSVSNETRNISLNWKKPTSFSWEPLDDLFYSQNVCGDGIKDLNEDVSCDPFGEVFDSNTTNCANTTCLGNEKDACFIGCHESIGTLCPAIPIPPGHISPGLPVRDDSLGSLIENQFLWKLPGIEHISNGFNIISGGESTIPIFSFGFCDNSINQTVQDTYRGNVYIIPDGLFAQPEPTCSFDIKTERFKNSFELSRSYAESASENSNANLGAKVFGIGASFSAAFSKSKAIESVNKLSTEKSGEIISTEVVCKTSRVQINIPKFHPIFLKRLATINSTTEDDAVNDLIKIMKNFGTHYYKKATLGGKLQQFTMAESNIVSNMSSQKMDEHVQLSFSASVSSPYFSASGGYGSSLDTSISSEEQLKFENNTTRSTILTYGGAPGSFGPTSQGSPSTYGDWAKTVDLLPVPVEFELDRIGNIINPKWFTENNKSIRNLWEMAEQKYYEEQFLNIFNEKNYLSEEGNEYFLQWNASLNYSGRKCWSYKMKNNDELLGKNEIFVRDKGMLHQICAYNHTRFLKESKLLLNSYLPYDIRNTSFIIDVNEYINSDVRSDVFNQTQNGLVFVFDKRYSRIVQYDMGNNGKPMNLSSVKDLIIIQSFCENTKADDFNTSNVRIIINGTLNFVEYRLLNLCPRINEKGITLSIPLTYPIGIPLSISLQQLNVDRGSKAKQIYFLLHPCKVFPEICESEQKDVADYFFHAFALQKKPNNYINFSADENYYYNGPLVPLARVGLVYNISVPIGNLTIPTDE